MTTLFRHAWFICLSGLMAIVPLVLLVAGLVAAGASPETMQSVCAHCWPFMWAASAYAMGYGEGRLQAALEQLRRSCR